MNLYSIRFVAEFAGLLTTALIHFVWQGAVLTLMLLVIVKTLDVKTARLRYLISVGTLLTMGLAPFLTISLHQNGKSLPRQSTVDVSGQSNLVFEEPSTAAMVVHPAADLEQVSIRPWNPRIEVCVLIAWLAGVLILSTRLAIGFGITLWIRANVKPLSEQFEQRVRLLGDRLGVNARNRVFTCMKVGQAVAVGFVRPVVLVPMAWLIQLTPQILEAVIAHELAHIRRWDIWVNLVQRVIETLLFYHPAVWWLSNRIRLEREMCCDEIAAGCFDRAMYARSLESVARIGHGNLLMASSINGGKRMNLLSRIRYLLGIAPTDAVGNWWAVGFVAMILPFLATVAISMTVGPTPSVAMADDNLDESAAAKKIELLGGKVTRDETLSGHPVVGINFDLKNQWNERVKDGYLHLLKSFTSLKSLNLNRTRITDVGLKELKVLKNLTTLELDGISITDDGFKEINELTSLKSLSLFATEITGTGLNELGGLKNLTTLNLRRTTFTNEHLKGLRKFKELKTLSLEETQITDDGMEELTKLTQLTTLNLQSCPITDVGLRNIRHLTNLISLNLYGSQITDNGLKEISQLRSLTTLFIDSRQITDAGMKEIQNLPNLTYFDANRVSITNAGLKEIGEIKGLTFIDLCYTQITDDGLKNLRGLKHLKKLMLGWTNISGVGFRELIDFDDLTTLAVSHNKITDDGMKEIGKLKNLKVLNLCNTPITDDSLKQLSELENLTTLYLDDTQITDAGLKNVIKNKSLTMLGIKGTKVTDEGIDELADSLPNLKITR